MTTAPGTALVPLEPPAGSLVAQIRRLRVEPRRIADLAPSARNARTHSAEQVAQLAASMREFGWTSPCLVDEDGGVIAGHGRILAAVSLGLDEVPCIALRGLSEAQKRALLLADNQLALNAGWNLPLLGEELRALDAVGFRLPLLGFEPAFLRDVMRPPQPAADPDDAPPLPERAVSRPGDTWILGAHRLRCGDATDMGAWDGLMAGEKARLAWTDPPYNVAYSSKAGSIRNDDLGDAAFRALLDEAFACLFAVMEPGAALYVAHADTEGENFRAAFRTAGFKLSGCLVWRKDALVLGRSDYQWMHEPILYGWKPGAAHRWFGGRKQTTVAEHGPGSPIRQRPDGSWVVEVGDQVLVVSGDARLEGGPSSVIFHEKPKRSPDHPTQKPLGLIEKHLRNSGKPGDLVADAFAGSGSTLLAAEQLGMRCRAMELDPRYADVVVRRWQGLTGGRAVLESGGQHFDGMEPG